MSIRPSGPAPYLALMITRRCNMTCGHCSVASSPRVKGDPTEAQLRQWVRDAAEAGVRSLRLTGGEPMLRPRLVRRLIEEGRARGIEVAMTSNGFWGRSPASARRGVRQLVRAGLWTMTISVDRFHAAFQDATSAVNLARAAERYGLPIHISFVRASDDEDLTALIAPFEATPRAHLRFYDLQAVGRARDLPPGSFGADTSGFCSACAAPAITDDGRLIACNGPAYFAPAGSPLVVGALADAPLATLLARHRDDPVLDAIRAGGPARLRDELGNTPGFESFPFRERYGGMCELCLQITSSPQAVAALRARLAAPRLVAERRAAQRVMGGNRANGVLSWSHVNGAGFARALLQLAVAPGHEPTGPTERLVRRADLDWADRVRYVTECGLARMALTVATAPSIRTLAPRLFFDLIAPPALREGVRELIQRDALRQLDDALADTGLRGVLVGSAAVRAFAPSRANLPPRVPWQLACCVPRGLDRLRAALVERGFTNATAPRRIGGSRSTRLLFQGVPLDLSASLMAPAWALPEPEILARARLVPAARALQALDPEGLVLHAATRLTARTFAHGFGTAWDLRELLAAGHALDLDRLADWVNRSRAPRAFWVSASVLGRTLEVPVPAALLARAPRDRRERDLERIADRLLFYSSAGGFHTNPISRVGIRLLLQDRWAERAHTLVDLAATGAAGIATRQPATPRWRVLQRHGREAWRHWRQYQRSRRADPPGPAPA